jgi:hypothetical protein
LPDQHQHLAYDFSGEKLSNTWHSLDDLWEGMLIGVASCCWMQDKHNNLSNVFDRTVKDL